MEYVWYILAALLAGVGTGLAGLSAATVMVPILIVLCPSFAGESGVYAATAIALASDIIGSALTTGVYIRHKNIDLKHGWIMLVCILSMCVAGSYVAFLAGNTVLGSFSLFLTFCIGIKFLIKPDTSRQDTMASDAKFGLKEIIISLFFGLTIGFGTGFVGTGGGMMMLVVFTSFLRMDLKKAVGTSTFIMTFTALIASVSHMLIEPTIILEHYDALIICIIVAALASLVSAQFANKVKNRTVGLVTGAVLFVLGAAMILLNYWDFIVSCRLITETLMCFARFVGLIVVCAIALLILRKIIRIAKPVFRKLLHLVACFSSVFMVLVADGWLAAALSSVLFAAVVFPALAILEKCSWYDGLFIQKKKGEVKSSLLLLFVGIAVVIALGWGVFEKQYVAVAAILMWGVGDTMAALVGIYLGKHKIKSKLSDGKKTYEGTLASFLSALCCGFVVILLMTDIAWCLCLLVCLPSAAVTSFIELISHDGVDTVTVPLFTVLAVSLLSLIG